MKINCSIVALVLIVSSVSLGLDLKGQLVTTTLPAWEFQTSTEASAILSRYVQVPSESGSEKEAGMFLAELCTQKNLQVKYFSTDQGKYNFAASI